MEQVRTKTKNRKFTAYAAVLAALALAIAIPVNLLASRLNVVWDMTPAGMYRLTDTTKAYLESMDKDVDFYFLCDMDLLSTDTDSMALYYALKQYAEYEHINFIDFDPDADPELVDQINPDDRFELTMGDMVFICGDNIRHLDSSMMYRYVVNDDDEGNSILDSAYFSGENYITGAIRSVATGKQATIYFLTGHGEKTLANDYQRFHTNLYNYNYRALELNLATVDTVPEDASILIDCAPRTDLTNDEARLVDSFLDAGGNVMFLMSPNDAKLQYTNIDAILEKFGIIMDYDRVAETDTSLFVSGDPYTFQVELPEAEGSVDLTKDLITMLNSGYFAFMSETRSFYRTQTTADSTLEVGSLIRTRGTEDALGNYVYSAVGEPYGGTDEMAQKITGMPLDLAMYSTSGARNNAKVFVMGNAEFIDDANVAQDYMIIPVYLMLSAISWMYDSSEDLNMGIDDKERDYDAIRLNSEREANMLAILFGVVPLCVGLIGAGVWIRRRYS
ncbi:MAG: GldG family protein [Oscillospiraceae bacterium]|nr:GldG family protein [Oscillospiraceae bacterium]